MSERVFKLTYGLNNSKYIGKDNSREIKDIIYATDIDDAVEKGRRLASVISQRERAHVRLTMTEEI